MFYKRFIQLCERNSEKPSSVLKKIGVSSGNLNNWKNGASIKSDILMQISEHFNVTIDYLLGKENNEAYTMNSNSTVTVHGTQAQNCKIYNNEVHGIEKEVLNEMQKMNNKEKAKLLLTACEILERKGE